MKIKSANPVKYETLVDFPAYSIHRPAPWAARNNLPVLRGGESIMVNIPGRFGGWTKFTPGSVFQCALDNDEDPAEVYENAKARGHRLKWINGCAVSITSSPEPKEAFFGYEIGDRVWFEGEEFTLELASNRNVDLKKV